MFAIVRLIEPRGVPLDAARLGRNDLDPWLALVETASRDRPSPCRLLAGVVGSIGLPSPAGLRISRRSIEAAHEEVRFGAAHPNGTHGLRCDGAGRFADQLGEVDLPDHLGGDPRQVDAMDHGVEVDAFDHGVEVDACRGSGRCPGDRWRSGSGRACRGWRSVSSGRMRLANDEAASSLAGRSCVHRSLSASARASTSFAPRRTVALFVIHDRNGPAVSANEVAARTAASDTCIVSPTAAPVARPMGDGPVFGGTSSRPSSSAGSGGRATSRSAVGDARRSSRR